MEPTTKKKSKSGRPKKTKAFRGSTPKQEVVSKCIIDTKKINVEKSMCIQRSSQELPIVNANALNDANAPIAFLPVNEIWQRQKCELFQIDLRNVLQVTSAEIAGTPSLTRTIRGDGNCFYRAISYLVLGTEEHHNIIRGFLLQHMLQIREIAREPTKKKTQE